MQKPLIHSKIRHHLKTNFFSLGVLIFLIGGLTWALAWPRLLSWRDSQLKTFVSSAQQSLERGDIAAAQIELQKASVLGIYSRIPADGWTDLYVKLGRYDKAAEQLSAWPLKVDNKKVGSYYLLGQRYDQAEQLLEQAIKQDPVAENYALLATSQLNQGKLGPGCESVAKISKNDLNNLQGERLTSACQILKAGISQRKEAYDLLQLNILPQAEQFLTAQQQLSPSDWATLANLSASRGDYAKAIERSEAGAKLDPTNVELQAQLARYYQIQNNQEQSTVHQQLLKLLRFPY